jgi:hypothetical protein
LLSVAALAGFAAGGAPQGLLQKLRAPSGEGLPALVVLAGAVAGLLLAFGAKRPKAVRGLGVALVLAAAVGALGVGVWRPGPGMPPLGALLTVPFERLAEQLLEHGGALTIGALLGLWGGCLLYNRFTPAYSG